MGSIDQAIQKLAGVPERTLVLIQEPAPRKSFADAHILRSFSSTESRLTITSYLGFGLRIEHFKNPEIGSIPSIYRMLNLDSDVHRSSYKWSETRQPTLLVGEEVYRELDTLNLEQFGPFLRLIEALGDFNRELPNYDLPCLRDMIRV